MHDCMLTHRSCDFHAHCSAEEELLELKEEFARRLGEQQRAIDILKVDMPEACCCLA